MQRWLKDWRILLAGLLGGLSYAALEIQLDIYDMGGTSFLSRLHTLLDWSFPVVVGLTTSVCLILFFRQRELNTQLSAENEKLKGKLITHTFASYILHEIRNPIHNLNAVLEKPGVKIEGEDAGIIERNLARLEGTTEQLKKMSLVMEQIDIAEATDFHHWISNFINTRFLSTFRKGNIAYEQLVPPLRLRIHSLLLEQIFTLLFDNALHALREDSRHPVLSLTASAHSAKPGYATVLLQNSGAVFSKEVLEACGRYMIKSTRGSGLGLVLVRDTLKQVHGELSLQNENGLATVKLQIPLESGA